MSDKIIIKLISKIYVTIVSIFSFIVLFLIFSFIVLQNGLYLDNLHISNIYLKNSYIKFDDKLSITVDELKITEKTTKTKNISIKEINNYLKLLTNFSYLIDTISISKINTKQFRGNFYYSYKKNSHFYFNYKDNIDGKINLDIHKNNIVLNIKKFHIKKFKSNFNGVIVLNTFTNNQYIKLNAKINNDANLTLYSISDNNSISYNAIFHNRIKHINRLLDLIPFEKHVKYWANTAIKADSLTIKNCNGTIKFNDIKNAYKNIYLNAVADHLKYKYNPKLENINTKKTILEFKNGILYIKPKNAYTYRTYLKNSWLKIDFTKKYETLDLYLMLDGIVNNDILYLLSVYKINLPFKQNKGLVNTNLHIKVNLRNINVCVDGDFKLKTANVDYLGMNLNLYNAKIHLHNSNVTISKMRATYKNILDTNITMKYNAHTKLGEIKFKANEIKFKGLILNKKHDTLTATYYLLKNQKYLDVSKSNWIFKNKKLTLNNFTMPYDIDNETINIPPILITMNDIAKAYISGLIKTKSKLINFDLDIFQLNYKGLKLHQTDMHLKINYNKKINIISKDKIYLSANGSVYVFDNLNISINDKSFKFHPTSVKIGDYIDGNINANYIFNTNKIDMKLNNFILTNPKTDKVLYENKNINLTIYLKNDNIMISAPKLNANFYLDKNLWRLHLSSVKQLYNKSNLLKKLNISNATVDVYKNNSELLTKFKANVHYKYALLMNKNKPIYNYLISGIINKNKDIDLIVNKLIKIKVADNINIDTNKADINLKEIIKLVKNIKAVQASKKNKKTSSIKLYLNAVNSSIFLNKHRFILSDNINLQFIDNIITAQLKYKKGIAGFKLDKNNNFYLYGKNFNDKFMQELSAFSKFKGGTLDFYLNGTFKNYKGVFFINKSIIVDYKVLNNILAFVNTVPSLITFSIPGYNKDGLYAKNAYITFTSKNDILNISDLYLDSKELKIIGKGDVYLKNNKINLTLNLKTDLASNVSKIPLVGYIVFNGKSISTTLKVKGKLDNPKIQTELVKDIVVAPLNIIKRTLTLPYKLIKKAVNKADTNIKK